MTEKINESPIVSLIIPSYNSAGYILETIKSIQSQELQNFEIIVVDDCSKDKTCAVVLSIDDPRIRCYRLKKNHGGPSLARSTGVAVSRAPYIGFCDSDDLLMPDMLAESIRFLSDQNELAMCFWDAVKFTDGSRVEQSPFLSKYSNFKNIAKRHIKRKWYVVNQPEAFHALFFENFILSPGCVVVKRSIFDKLGLFEDELKNADDWEMWLKIAKSYPIGFIDNIGLKYRIREGSVSGRGASLSLNRIKVLRKYITKDLPFNVRNQIKSLIAANYSGAGYACQNIGNFTEARIYFFRAFLNEKSFNALKKLIVSCFGLRLYTYLKKK
ncbi:MAG: glycosyltransferase family 2 protein [Desulfobacteraceae bacterium]|nr:glycosyltransferase family 2 protein [Desulfobacteraceae bacterium]